MASRKRSARYSSVAVALHWLIALCIVGLIVVAKVAHSLADEDPLRFDLIQWHKSFGIAVLVLVFFRIGWRLTHKPPALPTHMGLLERVAASLGHLGLYALMLAMPLTGWALVSASPLNLATELFGLIPWPHIPWLVDITDKDVWEYRFYTLHYWLANGLMALVAVHVLAALRHQWLLRDQLLSRMTIKSGDQQSGVLFGVLIVAAGLIGLFNLTDKTAVVQSAVSASTAQGGDAIADSQIVFAAAQMGEPLGGVFTVHQITLVLDDNQPQNATLNATVDTASVSTGDGQIDSTVVTENWFNSDQYPQASFSSDSITVSGDNQFDVSGTLSIREFAQPVSFVMQRQGQSFSGEIAIDRRDFGIGVGGQDDFVAPEVSIRFSFTQ
ncbi:MAG: cytochrome b/b6 domain-containing protein [Pseudomonadota bacterium]